MSMVMNFKNILLIQMGDIGDVVLTTPSIRAVRETCPNARITILVRKPFGSLLKADPNLYEVEEIERVRGSFVHILQEYTGLARRLRRNSYDLVIDLRTGDRGAILAFLTGAPHRIGCRDPDSKPWLRFCFTKFIWNLPAGSPSTHPGADQTLRFLRAIGIDTRDSTPRLYVAPNDRENAGALLSEYGLAPEGKWITINPFSRWAYKEWDNEKWGEVIDHIWETHHLPSALIGSLEDSIACQKIVAGREGHAVNLAGKTTLGELAAVISMSSLHLGVDSAAPHIAAALETLTVTIHGPSDWRAWRRANDKHQVVIPQMDCVPCNMMGCNNSGQSRCLKQLCASSVIEAADKILLIHG